VALSSYVFPEEEDIMIKKITLYVPGSDKTREYIAPSWTIGITDNKVIVRNKTARKVYVGFPFEADYEVTPGGSDPEDD
jgi:hypothetical protein